MATKHSTSAPLIMFTALIASLSLAGCTDSGSSTAPDPTTEPSTPSTPATTQSDADRFADMDARVANAYAVRESVGTFEGAESTVLTLPAPADPTTTKVVMLLTCTGTDTYWINVEQAHPNRVGATCGEAGTSIAAVPLDDPTASTTLEVTIPDGSQYWLTTYYTTK
jgi:hypothetical protein